MKKFIFICCIAISALAINTSANTYKQQSFYNYYAVKDTVPNRTMDTMHHNMYGDTMHNNMMDTGMNMHRDSLKTAPPHH